MSIKTENKKSPPELGGCVSYYRVSGHGSSVTYTTLEKRISPISLSVGTGSSNCKRNWFPSPDPPRYQVPRRWPLSFVIIPILDPSGRKPTGIPLTFKITTLRSLSDPCGKYPGAPLRLIPNQPHDKPPKLISTVELIRLNSI